MLDLETRYAISTAGPKVPRFTAEIAGVYRPKFQKMADTVEGFKPLQGSKLDPSVATVRELTWQVQRQCSNGFEWDLTMPNHTIPLVRPEQGRLFQNLVQIGPEMANPD